MNYFLKILCYIIIAVFIIIFFSGCQIGVFLKVDPAEFADFLAKRKEKEKEVLKSKESLKTDIEIEEKSD